MSENRQQPPYQQGEGYQGDKPEHDPPCPDPCDQKPKWRPPDIRTECCPPRTCCPDHESCCTWEEVDDPCIRAASSACSNKDWTKITCKCESSNTHCNCDVWGCGIYPPVYCVPCKPCEKLIPDPKVPDTSGCDDPDRDNCSSDDLRQQLDALKKCISSQQNAKARIEADIKARNERADALNDLIKTFDDILKKYKTERYKLICREDCLKGFYRDINAYFLKFPEAFLNSLRDSINAELCKMEMERCCQVNTERKLSTLTKLIWQQKEAEKELANANKALEIVKDLPKWLDDRFKELETLKDAIAQGLNDPDPEKQKFAFYLFYWKFVPKLCRCFPFPFSCGNKPADTTTQQPQGQGQTQAPTPPPPPEHLGCEPGDWHPSEITVEKLQALICCAWDYARQQKQHLQDVNDHVAEATANRDFVKKKVEDDLKTLDDRIKSGLAKIDKPVVPTSTSR
ncbi:MAG TPA: hypothetical protein VE980_06100 [Pyrinomonadaceae bacterium]|nr:hypothetical protein [Pyrinomonadaceae bacterium]